MSGRLLPTSLRFSDFKGLLICFSIGVFVRVIPELLAFPHPIGFDTVDYAVVMKSGVVWPHWSVFFTSSWLFPALSVMLYRVFGGDPFALLKVSGPLLFGLNVAGVYWFARKMLGWSVRLSLFAAAFFAFQTASLRISWDLLRNTLGLGVLLFTLPFIKSVGSKRGFACFTLLSLLTVFAHEFTAVTLLTIVLGLAAWYRLKGTGLADGERLLAAVSPAFAVFLVGLYLRLYPVRFRVESNVLSAGDVVEARVGGLFFLTDYLKVKTSVDWYGSYFDLALSVAALFIVLYLAYFYLVWKGFFKNHVLNIWTGLLSAGSFSLLILPFCGLMYWHRWMFMLVYPFTFYAANGFSQFQHSLGLRGLFCSGKASAMVMATALIGCIYLATPVLMSTVNVGLFSLNPVNRYISFAPTVPYEDVEGVAEAMKWLDSNMGESDCVLLQHGFLFWGQLYLSKAHMIVHFESDADLAVETAFKHGYSGVYFVWWNKPIGWYGVNMPESFSRVKDFGRISVYKHVEI